MIINPYLFDTTPPAATLYDLIMAQSPFGYFRHAETSIVTGSGEMVNQVGTNGSYNSGSISVGNTPLYSGGPTCVLFGGGRYGESSTEFPALTQLSIVVLCDFTTAMSGLKGIISSDDGSVRKWQWRTNGTSIEWVKIAGSVDTKTYAAGLTTGPVYMLGVDIEDSGSPGVSNIRFYIDGVNVYSDTLATVDYATGGGEILELGYCTGGGGINAEAYFSESCLFSTPLGNTNHAVFATAAGL